MSVALFRPRFQIAAFLKFTALCGLMLALQRGSGAGLALANEGPWSIVYPLGIAVVCALTVMRPKPTASACRTCGRRCAPRWSADPNQICPRCRHRSFPPEQRRRRESWALAIVSLLFLMLTFAFLWPLTLFMPGTFDGWAYPALAVGLFVFLIVAFFAAMVAKRLAASWRMKRPGHALDVARACAGEPGREITFGAVSVHVFGPKDPTPMLKDQMELCRDRFTALVGEPPGADRPLRVLAFGRRRAFDAFFRRSFLIGTNFDGMYVPWNPATIALTTEFPPYSLADPARAVRIFLGYYYLDGDRKRRLPQWLQVGIGGILARGGDEEELARLNRRMLASLSLSRNTALGVEDLFHLKPGAMVKLVRDWQDHGSFAKFTQFGGQSWSIVEYLWGQDPTEAQRGRFRGFLRDCGAGGEPHEATFTRHFGHGYDTLLEGWRASIVAQEVGVHAPLPPHLRSVLGERLIPLIEDRTTEPIERIQAVREMGRAGYASGADALIALLGTDDVIPSEEIVWSLEAISGLALGADKSSWLDWFERLPEDVARVAEVARSS